MNMPVLTAVLGVLLMSLGGAGYWRAGQLHALIPAYFGAVFLILGLLAMQEKMRKHAMHAAAVVALLGCLGTVDGVINAIRWALGTPPIVPMMVAAKSVMSVLCALFEALCVKSFIDARKARAEVSGTES